MEWCKVVVVVVLGFGQVLLVPALPTEKHQIDTLAAVSVKASELPSFLPPSTEQVQLANVQHVFENKIAVFDACGDDVSASGLIESYILDPGRVFVTWGATHKKSEHPLCNTGLYTSESAAQDSKCSQRAPIPLFVDDHATPSANSISGWADTHSHVMAERGFLGRLMWGESSGDISKVLKACDGTSTHGLGTFPSFPNQTHIVHAVFSCDNTPFASHVGQTHGYPDFKIWPRWNDQAHHQTHVDWLKKAHQDGMALLVATAVNNAFLCELMDVLKLPRKPYEAKSCDELDSIQAQLTHMKKIAQENSDWMEIALTPADARRIAGEGKLVVVLAVETSELPVQDPDIPVSTRIDKSLEIYFDLGVRSLQIVHEFPNELASSAFQHKIADLVKPIQYLVNAYPTLKTLIQFQSHFPLVTSTLSLATDIAGAPPVVPETLSHLSSCPDYVLEKLEGVNQWAMKHQKKLTFSEQKNELGATHNAGGLTPAGEEFLEKALKKGMIVDAAHMSRPTGRQAMKTFRKLGAPVFISHASLTPREQGSDFNLDHESASWVLETNGLFGLQPRAVTRNTYRYTVVENDCDGSIKSWLQSYQLVNAIGIPTAVAPDFNGLSDRIAPRFGGVEETCANTWLTSDCDLELVNKARESPKCELLRQKRDQQRKAQKRVRTAQQDHDLFDTKGLASSDLLGPMFAEMQALGVGMEEMNTSAEKFVRIWERVEQIAQPNYTPPSQSANSQRKDWPDLVKAAIRCWCPECHPQQKDDEETPEFLSWFVR